MRCDICGDREAEFEYGDIQICHKCEYKVETCRVCGCWFGEDDLEDGLCVVCEQNCQGGKAVNK